MKAYIDFETKSDIPIEDGAMKYLTHPSADIICMSYKTGHNKTKLWIPGQSFPKDLDIIKWTYAHNALFDYRVWHILGAKYQFPTRHITKWIDTMALCGRYGLPQSLDYAGTVLKLKIKKNPRGKYLIKKICCPPYKHTKEELYEFYDYCKDDVNTLYELANTLPTDYLSKIEQQIWVLTQKINSKGIPIDIKSVKLILSITKAYQIEHAERIPELTDYKINTIGQIKKIVKWVNSYGVKINNLQAETVTKTLTQPNLPANVKELLEMRQELGSSSLKKYNRMVQYEYKERIFDNLRYYGAGPGRWAGIGFQPHNLPRAQAKDAEIEINKFKDFSIIDENPIYSAKSLIRGMIKAPKGYHILASDFSAIEYILLCWITGDIVMLNRFAQGFDQYIDMASALTYIPYNDINDKQRFMGKVIILGCGFGLGAVGFKGVADGWGLKLTASECNEAVIAYRNKYPKVPKLWYRGKDMAVAAVMFPGKTYIYKKCKFKVIKDKIGTSWLRLILPSKRPLYYNSPELVNGKYGYEIAHMGINPYTKKWSRLRLIPGRITENIIQALARDLLAYAKLNLDDAGFSLIMSIHDEVVCEVPNPPKDDIGKLEEMKEIMCITPEWCKDLPLRATGFAAKRFKKA
jgi:DNA polymerase